MHLRVWGFSCLLSTAVLAAEPADCELSASGAPPLRVELYTSEGCSSCPPADRWLSGLESVDQLIVLAFHVDYWDDLGWPDRFADARFSQRQRAMLLADAAARGLRKPPVLA